MWGKTTRGLALLGSIGLLSVGCSTDNGTGAETPDVSETVTATSESATAAPETTTTTEATDESNPDEGAQPGSSECTVVITGDHEDTWVFDSGANSVGIATDYWFSDETIREAVEELGGSYDDFVEKGEPLVAFLGIYCSASDDPMDPGHGAGLRSTDATRATDLPMGPGSYPIVGDGTVIDDGAAGAVIADVTLIGDEIYETVADSGILDIARWDIEGIEGSLSFAAREMFSSDPKEIHVAVQFSVICEAPPYTCEM